MYNSSIWSNISDGMAIVSDAFRTVGNVLNGSQPQPQGYGNNGLDINMSRRDLPCYQPQMYNIGIPANYYTPPVTPSPYNMYYGGYTQPVPTMTYIPGMSDPNYGMGPSIFDSRGGYGYIPNTSYNPMQNNYVPLQTYQSPFMTNNNTITGYPNGGRYGY